MGVYVQVNDGVLVGVCVRVKDGVLVGVIVVVFVGVRVTHTPEPTLHAAWPHQGFRVKSGIRAGLSGILSGLGARLAVPT